MGKQRYTVKQVTAALVKTKGLVYLAARDLGCEPATIHNYAKRYAVVRETLVTARGEVVDVAEAALYKAILAGEQWAVLFALRTQGKGRGYVERVEQEVSGRDGGAIKIEAFDYAASVAAIAPGSGADRDASGEDQDGGDGAALGQDADGG